jgi:uncharacterized Tic20 family protein
MDPSTTKPLASALKAKKGEKILNAKDAAEKEVLNYAGMAFLVFTVAILFVGAGLALTTKLRTPTNVTIGKAFILIGGTTSIIIALLFLRL